jgi:tetratricopeptide (TPR) repeat protein
LNELFPHFRDPLYGVIAIAIFIFVTSFLTYSYGLYKERIARREYRKLLKRFKIGNLKEDDFVHLYKTFNLPFDSILLLASTFLHKGNYSKAISVYLSLLEVVTENIKKEELLEHLGLAYFKGGFLQRSKDIYLKILKFSPRNTTALKSLLIIYQKLNQYDEAIEILVVLDELNHDVKMERVYIKSLKILNDPIISYEKRADILMDMFKQNNSIQRLLIEFLIKYNKPLLWKNINKFDIVNILDLLWYLDFNDIDFEIVNNHKILQQLYTAKGYVDISNDSKIFELHVLIATKKSRIDVKIDLNFEFLCSKCKKTHPIYESRCPHCNSILTFIVEPKIAKQTLNISSFL